MGENGSKLPKNYLKTSVDGKYYVYLFVAKYLLWFIYI